MTGGPNGSTGVSQVRFADLKHGWAFGPALWQTSTGGWPWHPENTYGLRVIDLEATRQRAFAVFASCTGSGADYAGGCTSFSPLHLGDREQHLDAGGRAGRVPGHEIDWIVVGEPGDLPAAPPATC